ncbi:MULTISPECIES: ATP-grasp domain-containing protein [unclassified Dietzia]|uniref:ATP-grasp domain-containing protein n=1 Tax=unclassified Dietzia TaxID=2617939 RepID=UPI0015FB9A37|nr:MULTISPECIES: ATP-grasp domain-containing protein [unclassified Dietzia]MBB1023687.1 ATP-grasp domain-containing protein [Dietzia sp. DQ12-76]MBB1027247.1 ATP-grasp domain-containing protein [Dietzia sp. DQ11-38-2]
MGNILILSAGRRVELVQRFRAAAAERGKNELVVAVDSDRFAPALYAADHWSLIERVAAPGYITNLISLILDFDISLVVPTIDTELSTLAIHRQKIEQLTEARVLVASEDTINTCADKVQTSKFIQSIGLTVPALVPNPTQLPETSFPVFVKPRQGSSSIGAAAVHDQQQLVSALRKTVDPMVQELATGLEYTVDCFSDFNGRPLSIVPRQRLATRAGEISKGKVVRAPIIEREARHLLNSLSIPGPSTIQCFWDEHNVQFIEVNARFGGGAPMSIAAGSNSIKKLFRLLDGEELPFDGDFTADLIFLRYDQAICIDASGQQVST